MPPILRLVAQQFDKIGDAFKPVADIGQKGVEAVGGAGETAIGGVKDVADTAKDVADIAGTIDRGIDAAQGFIDWGAEKYNWWLRNQWKFELAVVCAVIFVLMSGICCAWQWVQCVTRPCCCCLKCGWSLWRKGRCKSLARCCIATKHCIPDRDAAEKRAHEAGKDTNDGCDSTFFTTCGGRLPMPENPNEARIGYLLHRACPDCVPASWYDRDQSQYGLSQYLDKYGNLVIAKYEVERNGKEWVHSVADAVRDYEDTRGSKDGSYRLTGRALPRDHDDYYHRDGSTISSACMFDPKDERLKRLSKEKKTYARTSGQVKRPKFAVRKKKKLRISGSYR